MNVFLLLGIIGLIASRANANDSDADAEAAAADATPSTPSAHLLASKRVLNMYIVEDHDLAIQYDIYNIGDVAATQVQLEDGNFPLDHFTLVSGSTTAEWSRIAAQTNVTHMVVLRPNYPMQFNFTAAQVQYRSSGEDEQRYVLSSTPIIGSFDGTVYAWDKISFQRQFSPHYVDWTVFFIMTIPSLGIPYVLYQRSRMRYDLLQSGK